MPISGKIANHAGNVFWTIAYHLLLVPLAALGLLLPLIAGEATESSSVCVVTNSLRLRRFRSWSRP